MQGSLQPLYTISIKKLGWRPREDTVFARLNLLADTVFARIIHSVSLSEDDRLVALIRAKGGYK